MSRASGLAAAPPRQGAPLFWRGGSGWQVRLGPASSAQRVRPTRLRNGRRGYAGYTAFGIEVPRAAVLALQPEGASATAPPRWRRQVSKADLKAAVKEFEYASTGRKSYRKGALGFPERSPRPPCDAARRERCTEDCAAATKATGAATQILAALDSPRN